MNQVRTPAVLLLDLGNIVNEFIGLREVRRRWLPDLGEDEIRRRWISSPALNDLECGRITPHDFARRFVSEWKIPLPPEEFLQLFVDWANPPFPDTHDLLAALSARHRLACLSNINPLHWDKVSSQFGIGGYFDHHFLSHEMGMVKPHAPIYEAVIADLDVPAGDILFLDDTPENVETALSLGINAHIAHGHSLRQTCEELGLL